MRLRRETGDFQIKVTVAEGTGTVSVNSIRTGLKAEDLIGEVVDSAGTLEVVSAAVDGSDSVTLSTPSFTITYIPSTGASTAVAVNP